MSSDSGPRTRGSMWFSMRHQMTFTRPRMLRVERSTLSLITSVGAAVTTWMEFRGLVSLLGGGEHRQEPVLLVGLPGRCVAGHPGHISRLILSGESVIADEFRAWSATTSSISLTLRGSSLALPVS